jgi:hypothetical protein
MLLIEKMASQAVGAGGLALLLTGIASPYDAGYFF